MMVTAPGGPDVLAVKEVEMPRPAPGEVLVRVIAAGVGPWDVLLREGGWNGPYPYIPGGEFAGLVEGDTGADAFLDDGAPVYGYPGLSGCYAEYVTCPVEQLAPIPAGLTFADAAAVPVDGVTAEQGLRDVLGVRSGDRVLITAGTGGLGHLAVQIAKALGASVIGTADRRNHAYLHRLGATHIVDHYQPDWPDQVAEITGGGVTQALASVAPTMAGAARAARDGADIATPVHADQYPDAERVRWHPYDGRPSGSDLIRMAPWFDDGSVSVQIAHRYYWHDAATAQREVAKGHTRGKITLIVDDDVAARLGV
jgi:NADPH:quinone reductase-like Zn-dependent oxidoreductase